MWFFLKSITTGRKALSFISIATICGLLVSSASAQDQEKPISFSSKLEIRITNPGDIERIDDPVILPLVELRKTAPDFNASYFRVRQETTGFEPLDITSQIRKIEGALYTAEDLVFQITLLPGETKTVEIWYNPKGIDPTPYPVTTQSFEKWYRLGGNIAWENELIAYRSYTGVIDFFAKSFPHLRLHNLPPDSYHHERFWGLDPYVIGSKPGLCGIVISSGNESIKCYGAQEAAGMAYVHKAIDGGPVCTGAIVQVTKNGELLAEEVYILYNNRHENRVLTILPESRRTGNTRVESGMQTFENMPSIKGTGYVAFQGSPVEEYGTISTALVWPADIDEGIRSSADGDFAVLKPNNSGTVSFASIAAWNRASAEKPTSNKTFIAYVEKLKRELDTPLKIELEKAK